GEADRIKEENRNQNPAEVTAEDRKKHKEIIEKISKELKKTPKKEIASFDDFYKIKKAESQELEDTFQPQLKRGINLNISTNSLEKEKEDNDIDFEISIKPNHSEGKLTLINPIDYVAEGDLTLSYGDGKKVSFKEAADNDRELLARIRTYLQKRKSNDDEDVVLGTRRRNKLKANLALARFLVTAKEAITTEKFQDVLLKYPLLEKTQDELFQVFISSNRSLRSDRGRDEGGLRGGRVHLIIQNVEGDSLKQLELVPENDNEAVNLPLGGKINIKLAVVSADINAIAKHILEIIFPERSSYTNKNDRVISEQHQHSEPAIFLALKMQDSKLAGELGKESIIQIYDAKVHVHTERDMCSKCAIKGHEVGANLQKFAPLTYAVLRDKKEGFRVLEMLVTSDYFFNKSKKDFSDVESEEVLVAKREELQNHLIELKKILTSQPNVVKDTQSEIERIESILDEIEMEINRRTPVIRHQERRQKVKTYRTRTEADFGSSDMETYIEEYQSGSKTILE
ncbi:MAG: hypothetical protein WBA74_04250, partial [Cyclobacteriaceae bacterium]